MGGESLSLKVYGQRTSQWNTFLKPLWCVLVRSPLIILPPLSARRHHSHGKKDILEILEECFSGPIEYEQECASWPLDLVDNRLTGNWVEENAHKTSSDDFPTKKRFWRWEKKGSDHQNKLILVHAELIWIQLRYFFAFLARVYKPEKISPSTHLVCRQKVKKLRQFVLFQSNKLNCVEKSNQLLRPHLGFAYNLCTYESI